jgi:hypothetical protein
MKTDLAKLVGEMEDTLDLDILSKEIERRGLVDPNDLAK